MQINMETLRDIRIESKKSPGEVAKALGVTERAYYRYEQGIRQINIAQVLVLARLFEISAEEVIQSQLSSCQFAQ